MPEEVLRCRPRLQIYYAAFHLTASGRFDAAEARLRDVERMLVGHLVRLLPFLNGGPSVSSPDEPPRTGS
jgi:hypothetical protein